MIDISDKTAFITKDCRLAPGSPTFPHDRERTSGAPLKLIPHSNEPFNPTLADVSNATI